MESEQSSVNVLVVGNGFDIAHDLPTKYSDFLYFMAKIIQQNNFYCVFDGIYSETEFRNNDEGVLRKLLIFELSKHMEVERLIQSFSKEISSFVIENGQIIKNNEWLRYFIYIFAGKCQLGISYGWIDFETEIQDCLVKLYPLINYEYLSSNHCNITFRQFCEENKLFETGYFQFGFCSRIYQEKNWDVDNLKIFVYDALYKELQDFTVMLRFYLQLVEKKYQSKSDEEKTTYKKLINLDINYAVSFNYTNTVLNYMKKAEKNSVHYINGSLKEKLILGIENTDVIQQNKELHKLLGRYFKNEQRIDCDYWYNYAEVFDYIFVKELNPIVLYFIGHSLDLNDRFVLLDLIKQKMVKSVIVGYYSSKDKQEKINRLHMLLGEEMFFKCVNNTTGTPIIELMNLDELK